VKSLRRLRLYIELQGEVKETVGPFNLEFPEFLHFFTFYVIYIA